VSIAPTSDFAYVLAGIESVFGAVLVAGQLALYRRQDENRGAAVDAETRTAAAIRDSEQRIVGVLDEVKGTVRDLTGRVSAISDRVSRLEGSVQAQSTTGGRAT
jgi:hypothetical protein